MRRRSPRGPALSAPLRLPQASALLPADFTRDVSFAKRKYVAVPESLNQLIFWSGGFEEKMMFKDTTKSL